MWIPLGTGTPVVRFSGKVYESIVALRDQRSRCDLYHSALELHVPSGRFVIEVTPVPDDAGPARGVVAEGSVGIRAASRLRVFRYEVRRWKNGTIPDAYAAIASPLTVAEGGDISQRILNLAPTVPRPVWGRDELNLGEMWNSNSVTSWLLERAGINTDQIPFPPNARAPGWTAGVRQARRAPHQGYC